MSATLSGWRFAALLAALSMTGVFSIDLYLPALPAIGRELHATPIALQQTLSAYLVAYAVMMLWHGALSDALGRRPIVLGALALYAFGTLGCAIAGNIESLWMFRVLQGMSAGSGLVIGRAIIRDRFHGPEAQRLMAQITLVFGVAPAVAPVLGGLLLNAFGWRSIFWSLLVAIAALFAWAALALPETLAPSARQPLHPRGLLRNYRAVLTRREFLLLAMVPSLNFSAFFLYIAVAPAFLIDLLGVSTLGFAWLFLPMIAGVMLGATLSGRRAGRFSPASSARLGFALMLFASALNVGICLLLPPGLPWNVVPIFFFTIGSALITPAVTLLILDLFPTMRGLASSLQGFLQFALSAFTAGSIAPLLAHSVLTLACGMAAFTVASTVLWYFYQLRSTST